MSHDSTELAYCQEKYIVGELLVRTGSEVVGGARVTPCGVTKSGGQGYDGIIHEPWFNTIRETRVPAGTEGTGILLEITKNGVSLLTTATVVYNLKDQFMGICFEEMPPDQRAILAGWIKAAAATAPINPRLTAP